MCLKQLRHNRLSYDTLGKMHLIDQSTQNFSQESAGCAEKTVMMTINTWKNETALFDERGVPYMLLNCDEAWEIAALMLDVIDPASVDRFREVLFQHNKELLSLRSAVQL